MNNSLLNPSIDINQLLEHVELYYASKEKLIPLLVNNSNILLYLISSKYEYFLRNNSFFIKEETIKNLIKENNLTYFIKKTPRKIYYGVIVDDNLSFVYSKVRAIYLDASITLLKEKKNNVIKLFNKKRFVKPENHDIDKEEIIIKLSKINELRYNVYSKLIFKYNISLTQKSTQHSLMFLSSISRATTPTTVLCGLDKSLPNKYIALLTIKQQRDKKIKVTLSSCKFPIVKFKFTTFNNSDFSSIQNDIVDYIISTIKSFSSENLIKELPF